MRALIAPMARHAAVISTPILALGWAGLARIARHATRVSLIVAFGSVAIARPSVAAPATATPAAAVERQGASATATPAAVERQGASATATPAAVERPAPTAARGNSATPTPPRRFSLTRRDAWFGAAAVTAVALATALDRRVADQAPEANGPAARGLAKAVRPLGAPAVVGPALFAAWGGTKLLGKPGLSATCIRIGGAVLAGGVVTEALKISIGRSRPDEAPADPGVLHPFSGKDSFPSGHATIAFGAAAALDRETAAGWVSWVAYPTAGLVGWSRLRDNQHWMSDVVAGALIGYWTANKAEDWLRARSERTGPAVGVVVAPDGTGPMLGARLSF